MEKILYPIHPVRCIITGPLECGKSYFLTNLILTRKWHSESADPANALDLSLAKQTNKQTDKQKILSTQRFQLSTLAFLAQCS